MLEIQYPKYEVKTPQTLVSFLIESLTVAEENMLRTSIINDTKNLAKMFDNLLFSKISNKPKEIQTLDDFRNKLTPRDRDALVAALYHVTYGSEYIVEDVCPSCRFTNTSKLNLENIGKVTYYEGKPFEITQKEIEVQLPVSQVTAYIKAPVLSDEERYHDILTTQDVIIANTVFLYTTKLQQGDVVYKRDDNPMDFYVLLTTLPARDRKVLGQAIQDKIEKYKVELKYRVQCGNCNLVFDSNLNFLQQLFRMVLES